MKTEDRSRIAFLIAGVALVLWVMAGVLKIYHPEDHGAECVQNLKQIGEALKAYAEDHDGFFPSGLHQLTPDYLSTVEACPDHPLDGQPQYRVTVDRRWMGLFCSSYHTGARHTRNVNVYPDSVPAAFHPDDRTGDLCRKELKVEAKLVSRFRDKHGRLPKDLKEAAKFYRTEYVGAHFLTPREDATFQIVCVSRSHWWLGLEPLHPRVDSSDVRSTVTPPVFGYLEAPGEVSVWLRPVLPGGILAFVLLVIGYRRSQRKPRTKTSPEF